MTPSSPPPAPPRRQSPRPLGPHLSTANAILLGSLAALPAARQGLLPWRPSLAEAGAALASDLQKAEPGALQAALLREVERRQKAFAAGLRAYQSHPYRRELTEPDARHREGSTRLFAYAEQGLPVLFVPSLINRSTVLDLSERRSLMRFLAAHGLRPWLVDWGHPGALELDFSLADYVERLGRLIDLVVAESGGPVAVVGYCLGGNLALAGALSRPHAVAQLGLLATPWDFHAENDGGMKLFGAARHSVAALLRAGRVLPVDMLQLLFLNLDPGLALRKFIAFGELDQASQAAADFVALEDWLNDGVPLVARVAEECLIGWYGDNAPARGQWRIGDMVVDPAAWTKPALVVVPADDRIVPPASAVALAARLPQATVLRPPLGHIGMMVGGRAEADVWHPLRDWLLDGHTAAGVASTAKSSGRPKKTGRKPRGDKL